MTRTDGTKIPFPERLMQAIGDVPVFVCLLGEREGQHTLQSDWVLREIERARELNKFCVPVFQESYTPLADPPEAVDYLLSFDGVFLFDQKNVMVDESIAKIARLIRPPQPAQRRITGPLAALAVLVALIAAVLISLSNSNSISPTTEALPPTAVALVEADTATPTDPPTSTPTPTDQPAATSTPTDLPTSTPTPTPPPTATLTPAPEQLAFTPVKRSADWTPLERSFDGVSMVLVPAGCFKMGSSDFEDARPVEEICFDQPFWIDRYEVTNAQFNRLSGAAAQPSALGDDDRPREQINWDEARAFCLLRGARLPTEAEWEYAARGPDGLDYPWGSDFITSAANSAANSLGATTAVGNHPRGASWVGAEDMSGNVWEWAHTIYNLYSGSNFPYPYATDDGRETVRQNVLRVVRGGSFLSRQTELRAAYRFRYDGNLRDNEVGFRCARDAAAGTPSQPAPEQLALTPAASNAAWTPQERVFDDGIAMVLVPAGCFKMGDPSWDDERPVGTVCFDRPFWIDRTEVTRADFERLRGGIEHQNCFTGSDGAPVECVTWFAARAFCAVRGARLPTEAEWEYAARGPDSLVYPWGNRWDADAAVWNRRETPGPLAAGSLAVGTSWVGALDMSGNVWEWTSSLYQPYPYDPADGREQDTGSSTSVRRVLRSGSWDDSDPANLRAPNRFRQYVGVRINSVGFRCAR